MLTARVSGETAGKKQGCSISTGQVGVMADRQPDSDINIYSVPRKIRAEVLFGIGALVVALLLGSQIGSQTKWINGLSMVKQPGFWPVVSIGGMILFGGFELFHTIRRYRAEGGEGAFAELGQWLLASEYVVWFMVYVFAVPVTGYLPTTLIFAGVLTFRLGYRSWTMIGAALATGLMTVIIFKSFLAVKIPGGAVYEYLPDAIRNFLILNF